MLPGDGIGPEVSEAAFEAVQKVGQKHDFQLDASFHDIGGASIDAHHSPLTDEALAACAAADAVFLGAVGGPQWDHLTGAMRPESGLLALRKGLNVYANLRPVSVYPAFQKYSPLKSELLDGVDIMVVRELTGGLYFGEPKGPGKTDSGRRMAVDTMRYDEDEIRRIAKIGFELARERGKKLASVDKANVLASSRLWRDVVTELSADYPDIELEHVLVDNCAMQLLRRPAGFDVIVTENMFGDILSDEAAMLSGSIGLLPSASIGDKGGLYEPVHGSAPDIAGTGKANPLAAMLSMAMMLRITLKEPEAADTLERAIQETIGAGHRCADLAGSDEAAPLSTKEMTEEVLSHI
jgi:3-isopropylmalate dehydrogenase